MGRLLAGMLAIALPALDIAAEAAVRHKRSGRDTLGAADALAGLPGACEIAGTRVWVSVAGEGDCIAFYPTSALGPGRTAVFYFEGDVPGSYRNDPRKLSDHVEGLRQVLARLEATYKVPYVFVARPGTFGSTGSHANRRKVREYEVMNAAVDAIRRRYDLGRIALAGQSGGATIAAAMLVLGRTDIECAAPASAGYDLTAMLSAHAERLGTRARHEEHPAILANHFNVMDRIGGAKADGRRRVFVIGDVADRVTPFPQQKRFFEAMRAAGHHAELLVARGHGEDHHGLGHISLRVAGLCASGAGDADIRRFVGPRQP